MTEKQGGSDVRANTTTATLIDNNNNLSFWSLDNNKEEKKKFRNADTIEIENYKFSEIIYKRICHLISDMKLIITTNDEDDNNVDYERDLVGEWTSKAFNHDLLVFFCC